MATDQALIVPWVSVVMPTYNDEPYLRQAIASILQQTLIDFELIIINDGSTDKTEKIVDLYDDERIVYLKNDTNLGNTVSRNIGMQAARGKYIAVMDSDDVAAPDRLETQYNYLEWNRDVGIVGGSKIFFDENQWYERHYPLDAEYISSFLFFKNAVGQPTVMMRRDIIEKHNLYYNPEYENAEDFDLWYRASIAGVKIVNLDKVLLYYRQSESQMSHESNLGKRPEMLKLFFKEKLKTLVYFPDDTGFTILHNFIRGGRPASNQDADVILYHLQRIENLNKQEKRYTEESFKAVLIGYRLRLIKCRYLDKRKYFRFAMEVFKLYRSTGKACFSLYWYNEGKYYGTFGENKKQKGKVPLPG